MNEIIDFEIGELGSKVNIQIGDAIFFLPVDNTLKFRGCGRVETFGNFQLRIKSELYYEFVPFSIVDKGVQVYLYSNPIKGSIGKATITNRYFEQITKEQWKIDKELNREDSQSFTSDMELSDSEIQFIAKGDRPLSMDDKWFLYFEDNKLHCIWSWTGLEVCICHFTQNNNNWKISEILVSNDWNDAIENKKLLAEKLIKGRLYTRERLQA